MNYKNYTDEELIEKLRAGDAEIADYIMEKYKPLVRKKTNAMYLIGGETIVADIKSDAPRLEGEIR